MVEVGESPRRQGVPARIDRRRGAGEAIVAGCGVGRSAESSFQGDAVARYCAPVEKTSGEFSASSTSSGGDKTATEGQKVGAGACRVVGHGERRARQGRIGGRRPSTVQRPKETASGERDAAAGKGQQRNVETLLARETFEKSTSTRSRATVPLSAKTTRALTGWCRRRRRRLPDCR